MPRSMSSDMLAALQSSQLLPALFVEAHFATGVVYLWSGLGAISWNGHTWSGVGSLGGISTIDDSAVVEAKGIVLTLSGLDPALLADVLQEFQTGSPVLVYLGLFTNASPPALISSPITSWAGRMDVPTVDVGADAVTITVACENRLMEMNVACDRRYTAVDQAIDFPGDNGFQFVSGVQERQIFWGRIPSLVNNPIFGPAGG